MDLTIPKMAFTWAMVIFLILAQHMADGLIFNVTYLTVILPMVLRAIIINFPALAIDWSFLVYSTIMTAGLLLSFTRINESLKNGIKEYGRNKKDTTKVTFLYIGLFAFSLLSLGYFTGPYKSFNV